MSTSIATLKMKNDKDSLALDLLKPECDRLLTSGEREFVLRVFREDEATAREMMALRILKKRMAGLAAGN